MFVCMSVCVFSFFFVLFFFLFFVVEKYRLWTFIWFVCLYVYVCYSCKGCFKKLCSSLYMTLGTQAGLSEGCCQNSVKMSKILI